ncbi:MAG: 2-dehydropantoate 2-reductase [Verrucomicrobiota bacterium]|jgi:2-dehydropantoate 2-reductase
MEIIVLGAGAIGSLYGAKLATANEVILVGRADHVAAINEQGLRIEGIEPQVVRIRATTAIEQIGANALVLLTTKVPGSANALASIAPLVRPDTTIVCLQNGLDSEVLARRTLDNRGVVLRGITQFGAIFTRPGVIHYMAPGYTLLEQHSRSQGIACVFTAAGLAGRISSDIARDIWHKLIFNCVVNPITAILGCEVGGIAAPGLDRLKELVIGECVAVARTQELTFQVDFLREISEVFGPSHNIASMLQDLRRGHATEIDYLNGAVAAVGAEQGVPCPVNQALAAIIKAMETKQTSLFPEKMLEPKPA